MTGHRRQGLAVWSLLRGGCAFHRACRRLYLNGPLPGLAGPLSWLNTVFERSNEHFFAFVAIELISILSRRLKRLVGAELSLWRLQTDA